MNRLTRTIYEKRKRNNAWKMKSAFRKCGGLAMSFFRPFGYEWQGELKKTFSMAEFFFLALYGR